GLGRGYLRGTDEDAFGSVVQKIEMDFGDHDKEHIPIDAAKKGEIRRKGRNILVETVVDLDLYFIDRGRPFPLGKVQILRNREGKGRITAAVFAHRSSIDKNLGLLVGRLEMQEDPLVPMGRRDIEFSFVPGNATIIPFFV